MIVTQTKVFGKQKKKLHMRQLTMLDQTVKKIISNPDIGVNKKGDLQGVKVYKFKMAQQEYLLAYTIHAEKIILLAVSTHENFYRDLKNTLF